MVWSVWIIKSLKLLNQRPRMVISRYLSKSLRTNPYLYCSPLFFLYLHFCFFFKSLPFHLQVVSFLPFSRLCTVSTFFLYSDSYSLLWSILVRFCVEILYCTWRFAFSLSFIIYIKNPSLSLFLSCTNPRNSNFFLIKHWGLQLSAYRNGETENSDQENW